MTPVGRTIVEVYRKSEYETDCSCCSGYAVIVLDDGTEIYSSGDDLVTKSQDGLEYYLDES